MVCVTVPNPKVITVRSRGSEATVPLAHDAGAFILGATVASDFQDMPMGDLIPIPSVPLLRTLGQTQTVAPANQDTIYFLGSQSGPITITIDTVYAVSRAGVRITFVSLTPFPHIVFCNQRLNAGTGYKSNATFAASTGANLVLMSMGGAYAVLSMQGVSLT